MAKQRFVGLDVHQAQITVAMVDEQQQIVLKPRKIARADFQGWVETQLMAHDVVVLEATSEAWQLVDELSTRVARVVVANPSQVKLIASSMVKTDKRDALTLARLLAADLIPAVWVPPVPVRELRALIQHRRQLAKAHRSAVNRLRSLCQRHHLTPPHACLDREATRAWWMSLSLPAHEQLIIQQNLELLTTLNHNLAAVDDQLASLSVSAYWRQPMTLVSQLPGMGLCIGMTILSAIGDIRRFPSAKRLVGYSGLGARVHSSGQTYRTGGVSKQGRSELRTALVEAAWSAVRHSSLWRERFEHLAARIGRKKAVVAIARKLLVVIWHLWTKQVADREAEVESVARRFMRWGAYHHVATSLGVSRAMFVRLGLEQLGIGQDLDAVRFTGRHCPLPPAQMARPPA